MHKVFTKVLLITLMLVNMIPVTGEAEEKNYNNEAEVLVSLGIVSDVDSKRVTKEYFIGALSRFIYDVPSQNIEDFARNSGILKPGEIYKGTETITVEKALEYAVITLGYGEYAKGHGGYLKVSSDTGISDGINGNFSDNLKIDDCTKILYNMLSAEPMTVVFENDGGIGYSVKNDTTLIYENRNIIEISGIMTANEYTSIYDANGAGKGFVIINGIEYKAEKNANDFLGEYVTVYVKQEKNEIPQILCIQSKENKNTILELDSGDIEYISDDYTYIEYENEKLKKAKLVNVPKVIFNGVFYGDYNKTDLMPDIGKLKLIDNNNDGKYDVVFVTSYQTIVVKSVDIAYGKIYNKLYYEGSEDVLELEEKEYTIRNEEKELSLSEVKNDCILSVAKSKSVLKNGSELIEIIVSQNKIGGTFTGVSEDRITIDGNEYRISNQFKKLKNTPVIGTEYSFYIDTFGNVVYFNVASEHDYFIIMKMYEEDERYYASYINMESEHFVSEFSRNIKLNNKRYSAEAAYAELSGAEPLVVFLKTNANGEIRSIDTPTESAKYIENKLTRTPAAKYTYRMSPNTFANTIYLEDNAKVVLIPESNVFDKDKYYIRDANGYFNADTDYTITAYNIDKFGFTDLVTMTVNETLIKEKASPQFFIVTDVSQVCVGDEVFQSLTGNVGDYRNMTLLGEDDSVFDGIVAGDVINININSNGKVDYAKEIFSLKDNFLSKNVSNYYVKNEVIKGTVAEIDSEKNRILIDFDGVQTAFRLENSVAIQSYNAKRNKCRALKSTSLAKSDKVICRISWGSIAEMIVIEKE